MKMFHDIIKKIPSRDYDIEGLEVHADHTSTGTIYFVSAENHSGGLASPNYIARGLFRG